MQILYVIISAIGWIFSMITFGIALNLKQTIGDMTVQISKRAFFVLEDVYLSQLPDYHGLIFAVFFLLLAYRTGEYFQIFYYRKNRMKQSLDVETQYLLKLSLMQGLEWGNIVITNIFIVMTLGLALMLSIDFAYNAIQQSKYLISRYENEQTLSQSDRTKFNLLQHQYPKLNTIIAFDFLSLLVVLSQAGLMICQKYKLKKSL